MAKRGLETEYCKNDTCKVASERAHVAMVFSDMGILFVSLTSITHTHSQLLVSVSDR